MIFSPELAAKVLVGGKTVTRRRLTHRDGRPIRYRAGHIYAVQPGRGKPHVGHILVHRVVRETLDEINVLDAQAEGFETISGFIDYWMKLHGSWRPREVVAVIWFRRADDCPDCQPLKEAEGGG